MYPGCMHPRPSWPFYVECLAKSILAHTTLLTTEVTGTRQWRVTWRCWISQRRQGVRSVSRSLYQFTASQRASQLTTPDLTHATLNFPENKGRAPELITLIDEARSLGSDITLDTYPYLPGCTTLAALLPSWAQAGGPKETLNRLQDEADREKIRIAVEVKGCDGGHGIPTDWSCIQVRIL
jgi:hypothetical protein